MLHTCIFQLEAQLFNGEIEGLCPTLLEFYYSEEVEVDTWEGISGNQRPNCSVDVVQSWLKQTIREVGP
jgi:hypothetical protein